MISTVKELIETLSKLNEECEIYLAAEGEVLPGHIEVKALMEKGNSKPVGVFLSTYISEKMERLINNN